MDERGKSGAFVDVKDSSEHGENIIEETVDVLLMSKTAQNTVRIYLRKQSMFCSGNLHS